MEAVVAGELSAIVEGDGLAPCRGEGGQQAGDGVGGDVGMLAGEAGEEDQAGVALNEGQEGGAVVAEEHQVPLPMAKGGAVGGRMGALAEGDSVGDVDGRAAAAPAAKAALGLGPGQVAPPGVVLLPRHLGVDEPVDALMGDDPPTLVQRETPGHLRRRPARAQTGEDLFPQGTVPLQPGAPPTTGVGLLVCIAGLVAQRAGTVALQLPSHRRWRAIHTCCDLPD